MGIYHRVSNQKCQQSGCYAVVRERTVWHVGGDVRHTHGMWHLGRGAVVVVLVRVISQSV